jgi:hypothetical protein
MPGKRLNRLTCAAGLALLAGAADAASLAGVDLQPAMQSRGGGLVLASCGVKRSLAINHYVSALYVPRNGSVQALRNPKAAKAVQLHITNDKFLPGEVPAKWRNALARALPAETVEQLDAMMKELRAGDRVTISYQPAEGVSVLKNGGLVVRAAGHRAIDEILRTWAKDAPVTEKIAKLAENPCSAPPQQQSASAASPR